MTAGAAIRPCPFCRHAGTTPFGRRGRTVFVRCTSCSSVFQTLSPAEFALLHEDAFTDESFVEGVAGALGDGPDRRTWEELRPFLPGTTYLEIGPGSGHLLAAAHDAGRAVAGIEASAVHRDFIQRTWGLDDVYPSFAELPDGSQFDAIVAMNTLEHVYDIGSFLAGIRALLAPTGVFFLSTVNPAALSGKLVRAYWAMCKPLDHVSFPSAEGLRSAGGEAGLSVGKVWYGELPLETPISVAVAARDFLRARRSGAEGPAEGGGTAEPSLASSGGIAGRAISMVFEKGRGLDPTSWALGRLGMATMIKATLTPAARPA